MKRMFIGLLLLLVGLGWSDEVVNSFDAPDIGITGLAWGNGSLWAVSSATNMVYELDPSDGDILSFFPVSVVAGHEITGLTFHNTILYVGEDLPGTGSSAYIYKYSTLGVYQGHIPLVC